MSDERLIEQFKLLKRAKKLEQMGNPDRALDLYLELHERYEPNTSDAYERPAVLLERQKRYQEAYDMCKSAIEEIENDRMSGTVDKFQKRLDSIKEKMAEKPTTEEKSQTYKFGIIGFRSKNKGKMLTSIIFYLIFFILGVLLKSPYPTLLLIGGIYAITFFVDFIQVRDKKYKLKILATLFISLIVVIVSSINLPAAVNRAFELESSEGQLEGGSEIFKDSDEYMPKITTKHIEEAIEIIKNEIEVEDANIIVSDKTISFALLLLPSTDTSKAKDLGEQFIEILAHRVSGDEDISAPTFNSHGELYDYYSIIIAAGDSTDKAIAKGKKNANSKYITWLD
ncbi:MAG: hypothetical protein JEZ08_07010 [Clostridiales bacterium]|nr:hypothetical protein [Clostridiales bacterium]